jgi:lysophospholipase L1-like esterase
MSQDRRNFIRTAALGSTLALSFPAIVSAATATGKSRKIRLKENDVILFQGDSITDMGRDRKRTAPNDNRGLGPGYTFVAASQLLYTHPDKNLKIYNRGISGNVVPQLAARWDQDCLDLKPTVLSILIGVNDYWHTLNGSYKGTLQDYRDGYRQLLERTRKALPDVQLIIGEPYAVKGARVVNDSWFPAFDGYRKVAREMADSFGAIFIPYQQIYGQAVKKSGSATYWTKDGVHPDTAGDALMASALLKVMA